MSDIFRRTQQIMRSSKVIHVVSCHAEGEVGDVIVGGVAPPPGETLWEQRTWIEKDNTLRNFILNEPRGGRSDPHVRKWISKRKAPLYLMLFAHRQAPIP